MLQCQATFILASRLSLVGAVTIGLLLPALPALAQQTSWPDTEPATFQSETTLNSTPAANETVISADLRVPQFEANSIIAAVLCFAVGFGACLLVVQSMLPALVHTQCTEIVRDHLDRTQRESDIRVVVVDRDRSETLQKPRRATLPVATTEPIAPTFETPTGIRVDRPTTPGSNFSFGAGAGTTDDQPDAMLSQIYQQNLHLRDQLRDQSRSTSPTISKSNIPGGAD